MGTQSHSRPRFRLVCHPKESQVSESTLILGVDSRQVKEGAKSLDDLAAAGAKAEKSTDALTKATSVLAGTAIKATSAHAGWMQNMAGVDRAMRAASSATVELSKETQRIIDRYDPLGTKLRSLQSDFALLRREMGNSGSEAAIKSFQGLEDEIEATRKLMGQAGVAAEGQGKATQGLGLNTQYARRELMMLGKEALTGDFSRMPQTFMSLVTHSNLLQAAMSPLGLAIAGVTTALVAGAVAFRHYENVQVESAEATLNAIAAEYDARAALEAMTETSISRKIQLLDRELVAQRAYADDVSHKITRFNWRSSAEELAKFNREIEKNLLLRGQLVTQQPVAESEAELARNLAANKRAAADARREEEAAAKKATAAAIAEAKRTAEYVADIDKDRLYKAFEEDKAGRIAHSQFLLTLELGRIKDTAQAEKDANQEAANAAIREYLRRGEASAEINEEYVKQQEAMAKADEARWKMIDGFAHDAFDNIFDKGKNAFEEIGKVIKKSILDMLYKMTIQKWIFSIGVTSAGVGASSMASAAGLGNYGGGTGLMDIASSGLGMAMSGLTATQSLAAASAYGSAALSATSLAEGISMATSGLSLAMPYIGAAIAVYSLLKGNKSTPGTNVGAAYTTYDPTGTATAQGSWDGLSPATNQAGVSAFTDAMNQSYRSAAQSLGITAASTIFSLSQNLGANSAAPQFAIRGGVASQGSEMPSYFSEWTSQSDAAMQLAASRAVFTALQESELPQYLAHVFDGLTAGSMTQQDIDNTLAFAGSVKQMREALLETRTPLEVLRANVNAGTLAFATSAETFRTDFVAAIDAGISPQVFEQWRALGTAIDQLAAADADIAAQNVETLARAAEDAVRYQTTMLDLQAQIVALTGDAVMAEAILIEQRKIAIAELNASDPTGYLAALTTQLWGLQDAADATAIAAQAAADAFELITSSLDTALNDARNILRASIDAAKSALQAAYETELITTKSSVDSISESVRKLTNLSSLLKSTVTSMAVGVTRESAQAQLSAALAVARAGGVLPSAESLQDTMRTLSQPSESKFGSYVDYMRDFITTSNDIAALAELTDEQLTEQEQALLLAQDSLEILTLTYDANVLRLDGIWEEATGIRYAVIDVATALANFQDATNAVTAAPQVQGLVNQQVAAVHAAGVNPATYNAMAVTSVASQLEQSIADMYQSILGRTADVSGLSAWASSGLSLSMIESQIAASAEAQARTISVGAQNTMIEAVNAALGTTANIRAYADGSNYIGYDQLAMLHRGETVTPAPFVDRERTAREETNALLARLREEVSQLRAENKAGQVAIARNTNRSAKVLEQFDGDGLPAERVI